MMRKWVTTTAGVRSEHEQWIMNELREKSVFNQMKKEKENVTDKLEDTQDVHHNS